MDSASSEFSVSSTVRIVRRRKHVPKNATIVDFIVDPDHTGRSLPG